MHVRFGGGAYIEGPLVAVAQKMAEVAQQRRGNNPERPVACAMQAKANHYPDWSKKPTHTDWAEAIVLDGPDAILAEGTGSGGLYEALENALNRITNLGFKNPVSSLSKEPIEKINLYPPEPEVALDLDA